METGHGRNLLRTIPIGSNNSSKRKRRRAIEFQIIDLLKAKFLGLNFDLTALLFSRFPINHITPYRKLTGKAIKL